MIEYYIQKILAKDIIVMKDKINIIKLDIEDLKYNEWLKCANVLCSTYKNRIHMMKIILKD